MDKLNNLSKKDLIKLLDVYAKNWQAHDGCWFLAIEEKLGMDAAIEFDIRAWEKFSVIEANRIMTSFGIPVNGGLKALAQALPLRLTAGVNRGQIEWIGTNKLRYSIIECRVQKARCLKKLPAFPCKEVGLAEYKNFAKTINPHITTKCIQCPPDAAPDSYCQWEFELNR